MNTQDLTNNLPERPSGTYTLNPEGKVIKSQGLKDFKGPSLFDTRSPFSSLSSLSSSWSSPRSAISTISSTESANGFKAADDVLNFIDGVDAKYAHPKLPRKTNVSSLAEYSQTTPGISTADIVLQGTKSNLRSMSPITSTGIRNHQVGKVQLSNAFHQEEADVLLPNMPFVQDGIHAVRLPPIVSKEKLNDIFRKDISDKVKVDMLDFIHNVNVASSSNGLGHSKTNQELSVVQPSKISSIDKMIEEFQNEIIKIDSDTNIAKTSQKKRGFRNLLCGFNGENEDEDESKADGKEKKNVFQRMWGMIKKIV